MSYNAARRNEIRNQNIRHVGELVKVYDPNKKTVILLPGGMGSQLERTVKPYKENNPAPFKKYETVWIDIGIIFDFDALTVEIQKNGRDKGSHIIIPNGPLRFFINPYDETEKFFRNNGYNYTVYGFDWRRPTSEYAAWLHDFLRRFRDGVIARFKDDKTKNPLTKTTLLCHSQGGYVAKVFLHRVFNKKTKAKNVSKWMEQLITVATPFYGNSTHINRYYKGVDGLNLIYGTKKIASISGTLPAPYILLFLDKQIYNKDGAKLGLNRYPVRDADNDSVEVDPYASTTFSRYPDWVNKDFLRKAKSLRKTLAKELPQAVMDRVFHIRSGKNKETWIEKFWTDIDGSNFNPEKDPLPITGKDGPGDGTVPFWAARLAQTPDSQIYNLKMAKDHMSLLEHEETLKAVQRIIESGVCPRQIKAQDKYLGVPRASRKKMEEFLLRVKKKQIKIKDKSSTDAKVWRRIIEEASLC
ncbi:lysophospholipase [Desulfobacterota bacterium AH_259_B03_O07]|nr:lysophospholipase [Desulfobacterota bacterium AH_259_B03_O07]